VNPINEAGGGGGKEGKIDFQIKSEMNSTFSSPSISPRETGRQKTVTQGKFLEFLL